MVGQRGVARAMALETWKHCKQKNNGMLQPESLISLIALPLKLALAWTTSGPNRLAMTAGGSCGDGEGHSIYFYNSHNQMLECHSGSSEKRLRTYAAKASE